MEGLRREGAEGGLVIMKKGNNGIKRPSSCGWVRRQLLGQTRCRAGNCPQPPRQLLPSLSCATPACWGYWRQPITTDPSFKKLS